MSAFNTYQNITKETSGSDELSVLTLGLVGEAIETLIEFDDRMLESGHQKLTKELGDVFWYIARISQVLDFELDFIVDCSKTFTYVRTDEQYHWNRTKQLIYHSMQISEHVKKYLGHGHSLDNKFMFKHLRNCVHVISYISRDYLNKDLEFIATKNTEKLRVRYPNGFESERSLNRNG